MQNIIKLKFKLLFIALCMPYLTLAQTDNRLGSPTNFSVKNKPYSSHLRLNQIEFDITSPNLRNKNVVTLVQRGIKKASSSETINIDGQVVGSEIADLNQDGYPEIYIYISSANSHAYGSIKAYASNQNQSLTPIYIPEVKEDSRLSAGYTGHDEFAVVENKLMRRFPISKKNNVQQFRQIQYVLMPGESGWILKSNETIEF